MHGTKHGLDLGVDRKQQAKIKELPGEKKKTYEKVDYRHGYDNMCCSTYTSDYK